MTDSRRPGNQRFTVRVVVEFDTWPGLKDVANSTVESCAVHKVQNVLDKSGFVGRVVNATVTDVKRVPIGT
jgi:hypothetical protein